MTRSASLLPLFALAVVAARPAPAQEAGERLIIAIPSPFTASSQVKGIKAVGQIYRPPGQTDDNWTVQIAVETVPTRSDVDPAEQPAGVLRAMDMVAAKTCKDHVPMTILPGTVNGYTTATTFYKCSLDAASGKPESAVIHVIGGTDKIYMIIQTARAVLTREQIKPMIAFLGTVKVCDSRTTKHPCPT